MLEISQDKNIHPNSKTGPKMQVCLPIAALFRMDFSLVVRSGLHSKNFALRFEFVSFVMPCSYPAHPLMFLSNVVAEL